MCVFACCTGCDGLQVLRVCALLQPGHASFLLLYIAGSSKALQGASLDNKLEHAPVFLDSLHRRQLKGIARCNSEWTCLVHAAGLSCAQSGKWNIPFPLFHTLLSNTEPAPIVRTCLVHTSGLSCAQSGNWNTPFPLFHTLLSITVPAPIVRTCFVHTSGFRVLDQVRNCLSVP